MTKDIGNLRTRLSFEQTGQSNLTDLKRDMRGVQSEMNNFRSSSRGYRTSTKGMRKESDILSRRLQVQRERVSELGRRYEESRRVTGENSRQTKELAAQYNNAQGKMKKTQGQLERLNGLIRTQESRWTKLGDKMQRHGKQLQDFGRATSRFGRSYTMRVTTPILAAAAAALKVGADFEEGMSEVQAITGAAGDDLQGLEDQARELGASTRYSATEAADGMSFLARAGFEVNEITEAMPPLLDLAASANMELGEAADITSNIMQGFGLEADETGRISDVLAKSAATANTNVEQMGGAMSYVAPVAEGAGLEIEETAAAIGTMSDAGIQGQRAGRGLRKIISSLQNPTGKSADAFEDLGINMKDVDPAANSLSDVLNTLSDAGVDSATAMEIAGEQAGPALTALLKEGGDSLEDYTGELKDSEGAAEEMAETMEDNAKGSMREFKSSMEEIGIAASEHMLPAFTDIVDKGTELARKFGELDDDQQKQILKWLGIVAAVGPASLVLGQAATAIGGVTRAGGALFKVLGRASGVGLLASFSSLGPLAIGGIAVAGLAAVGAGVYKLIDKSNELEEVNLDTAKSFADQASDLEESADTFDRLSRKTEASNSELATLNDLNKEISKTSSPDVIEELQSRYDDLARETGLSKDELEELIEANDNMIENSDDVEKTISDQGNAFAENTDAVREYIDSLYDVSREELLAEIKIAEENLTAELETQQELKEDMEELDRVSKFLRELDEKSEKEQNQILEERLDTLDKIAYDTSNSQQERIWAQEESEILEARINGNLTDGLEKINKQRDALKEKQELNEEELAKLEELDDEMANLFLQQVGINEKGQEGLDQLDETINKNQQEIDATEKKLENGKELTKEEYDRYESLKDTTSEQREQRDLIFDELGVMSDINSLVRDRVEAAKGAEDINVRTLADSIDIKETEEDIVGAIEDKNSKLLETREGLVEEHGQQGANKLAIEQQIDELDEKIGKNDTVYKDILKELGIWDDVKDEITFGNDKLDDKNQKIEDGTIAQTEQGDKIEDNNRKTSEGTTLEELRTAEAGKDVDKYVYVTDNGTVLNLNRRASASRNKSVFAKDRGTVSELDRKASASKTKPVSLGYQNSVNRLNSYLNQTATKPVDLIGRGLMTGYADGTGNHPGGPFIAGEEGYELGKMGDKWEVLNTGLYDRPKGYEVFTHEDSKRMMMSMNNMPKYADGTGSSNVPQVSRQTEQTPTPMVFEIHVTSSLDGKKLGKSIANVVTDEQNRKSFRGRKVNA